MAVLSVISNSAEANPGNRTMEMLPLLHAVAPLLGS